MKENGMNKLIELLNEYELKQVENSEWLDVSKLWIMDWTLHYYNNYKDELVFDNIDLLIISARYWFIQWLVKNDKINFRKADADISKDVVLWREPDFADFMVYRRFLDEEKVLMLLSIQDNPIEFLISILR